MSTISHLEPENVFHYFEEICNIPHGSGNIDRISDYLKKFAEDRGLFCIQDECKNIIIIKEATEGYEKEDAIILQGHMDMVAVKDDNCDIDMEKEPIKVTYEGDRVYAEGTSLGGDDGMAVAYSLAILDANEIAHPRLEVIITVDEETGMEGAISIDLSMLKGRRMINLDSEEEGYFLTSCAGGVRADVHIPVTFADVEEDMKEKKLVGFEVSIACLQGGHSGTEIHKGSGNAHCLISRMLYEATKGTTVYLSNLEGGVADNAIPRQCMAYVLVEWERKEEFKEAIQNSFKQIKKEYATTDPKLQLSLLEKDMKEAIEEGICRDGRVVNATDTGKVLQCVLALPNGVQAMSADVEGLVETSLNMGIVRFCENEFVIGFAVRSSVESAKQALCDKIEAVAALAGAYVEFRNGYPGWAFRKNSPLREKMIRVFESVYGRKPMIQALHAGLECGILSSKIEGLDCISIGPDMANVHTTEESISISSTKRTWEFLLAVLADKDIV